GRAALMAHAHDDEIVRRHDERLLAAGAGHEIGAARQVPLALAVHPEQATVFPPPPRRRGCADKRGPALGQQTRAVPYAVSQVQQPEARPVARRPVVVSAEQEVAPRIGLEDLTPDADAIEERA